LGKGGAFAKSLHVPVSIVLIDYKSFLVTQVRSGKGKKGGALDGIGKGGAMGAGGGGGSYDDYAGAGSSRRMDFQAGRG